MQLLKFEDAQENSTDNNYVQILKFKSWNFP